MIERADLLESLIFRPRPDRQLVHFVLDVLEACVPDPGLEFGAGAGVAPDLVGAFEDLYVPFSDRAAGEEGPVVGVVSVVEVLEFGPAAWCGVSRGKGGC